MSDAAGPRSTPSFGDLYAPLAKPLAAWCALRVRGRLRDLVEPQDLAQDVLCRAFLKFATFDPARGPFRHWLFGVANNVLRELLAAAARPGATPAAAATSSRDLFAELPADATSVSRAVMRDEAFAAFVARLDELPDEDRRLVVYRGLEDLDHAEAAELLGVSCDAVKKRWQRLVRRLAELRPPPDLFAS